MTYCLAIQLDEGLVFCSDSRTNAGADRVSTYSKMHRFAVQGDRSLILLTAGNLATSQAVVSQIQRDFEENAEFNISDAKYVSEKYRRPGGPDAEGFNASASFILGGQVRGQHSELYLIYPEGNYITASEQHPYLQIGETKYGKPILDRIIQPNTSPEIAMRCGLLSIDSTMRSNATVGPPLECLFYRNDSLDGFQHYCKLEENHPYLTRIRQTWDESIRSAFQQLPSLTEVFEAD